MDMHRKIADATIAACLTEIHGMLTKATQIAKAAEACAKAGSIEEGVQISMDIEQIVYETGRLQDAVSLLNRLGTG
jgi:hypothetical protein